MKTLKSDIELLSAALTQVRVTVRDQDGRITDYGGLIERYSPDYVRVAGTYYARLLHVFTR